MNDIKQIIQFRDLFKDTTNILDEMVSIITMNVDDITLEDESRLEDLTGRFMIKMMQLNSIE